MGGVDIHLVAAIEERETLRQRAMCNADARSLDSVLHDDLLYIHATGRREDKAANIALATGSKVVFKAFERPLVAYAQIAPDIILLDGRMRTFLEIETTPKTSDVLFLAIWVRDSNEGWRMRTWQSTLHPES